MSQYQCTRHCSLGTSLPENDTHACSVSLPTWKDVVAYEEGCPVALNAMTIGYPRFRYHNDVSMLNSLVCVQLYYETLFATAQENRPRYAKTIAIRTGRICNSNFKYEQMQLGDYAELDDLCDNRCLVLPGLAPAMRFREFLLDDSSVTGLDMTGNIKCVAPTLDLYAVFFHKKWEQKAKSFWQHSGEILSSRQASTALEYYSEHSSLFITCAIPPESKKISAVDVVVAVQLKEAASSGSFNQVLGEVEASLTSARARVTLTADHQTVLDTITNRISQIVSYSAPAPIVPGSDHKVVLTVSGMSAVFTALRVAKKYHQEVLQSSTLASKGGESPPPDVVVFGFPYLDTLKIMRRKEWNKGKCHFLGKGDEEDWATLKALLEEEEEEEVEEEE